MAKYIKSVRIRRKFANGFDTKTELDIRVAIYDKAFSKRSVLGVEATVREENGNTIADPEKLNKIWPEVDYSGSRYKDLSDDEILADYIRTQSKLNSTDYSIIQDPWTPEAPIFRSFGFDPYYLNNGTELYVKWFKLDDPIWTEVSGTYESNKTGSVPNVIDISRIEPTSGGTVSANSGDRYLVGKNPTGPNWSKYGNTLPIVEWSSSISAWIKTQPEEGMTVYVDLEDVQYKYREGSPVIVAGGSEWSDKKGNEMDMTSSDYLIKLQGGTPSNPKSQIIKKVETINQKSGEMLMLSVDNTIVKYGGSASREIPSNIDDTDIVRRFIDDWRRLVPNYDLKLCDPANQKCELIEYISPIEPLPGPTVEPTGASPSGGSGASGSTASKQKLTIVFPENFKVMAREDVPKFSIWIGEPQAEEAVDDFQYGDGPVFEVGEEYQETAFVGSEEDFQNSECQFYENEADQKETEQQASQFNNASANAVGANGQLNDQAMKDSYANYVPGKHKLDMIPGELLANGKAKIKCCAIPLEWYSGKGNVKPINVVIAPALIDMLTAAKKAGHNIVVTSGFRPGYGPNLNAKTEGGLSVSAESQEALYAKNCPGGVCKTDTAKPGSSRHGNGIAVDLNTGTRDPDNIGKFGKLREDVYKWMVKNSWKFGFVRAVKSEEWHWEYYGDAAIKGGPYYKIGKGGGTAWKKSSPNFYSDLGLDSLQSPNYT